MITTRPELHKDIFSMNRDRTFYVLTRTVADKLIDPIYIRARKTYQILLCSILL